VPYNRTGPPSADVAELQTLLDSGSSSRKGVEVQVLLIRTKQINNVAKTNFKASTEKITRLVIEASIRPFFGHRKAASLTTAM
jgi:hypothetical protein